MKKLVLGAVLALGFAAPALAEDADCCQSEDGKMSACCEKSAGEKMACCEKREKAAEGQ